MSTNDPTTKTTRQGVSLPSERVAFRITELARILPFSRRRITELVNDGRIKSARIGCVRVIAREEVERILNEGC